MESLNGIRVDIASRKGVDVYDRPVLLLGVDQHGRPAPLRINSDGALIVGGTGASPYMAIAPTNPSDFSMFPGGVLPGSGVYFALDQNWIYTIDLDNGETAWQSTARGGGA